MWMITVSFGSNSCPLLFKTVEAAQAAWNKIAISPPFQFAPDSQSMENLRLQQGLTVMTPVLIQDDFGRSIFIATLNGAVFEDMNAAQEGQIEIGLHQARGQVKAQQRGASDPVLQAAHRLQQGGPAILSPGMGPNGRMF